MHTQISKIRKPERAAFTLVEMLVSVTLVLLMMTLFASMFQMATGSMTKQRGISQLDQSARVIDTVIRRDFQKRTFRYVQPFYEDENSATSPTSFSNRAGYLYFSTNDEGGGDDIVQFTVDANILNESSDATPFFGRANQLLDRVNPSNNGLRTSPNQPEADDGSLTPNFVASSPTAEITYFIRHGNLYRRINLIREPLSVAGQNLSDQPTSRGGYDFFSGVPTPNPYDGLFDVGTGTPINDFHLMFDLAGFATGVGGNQSTTVLGTSALGNETNGAAAEVLANPRRRFGFNPLTGFSREHTQFPGAGVSQFLGRFLHAETSCLNFNWPQGTSRNEIAGQLLSTPDLNQVLQVDLNYDGTLETTTNGNPYDLVGCPLALNPGNGIVSAFDNETAAGIEGRGGSRRVEDLLLANVHEMKVELWDSRLQRFVPPGHNHINPANGQAGDYHSIRNLNPAYGPRPGTDVGAVFDTWHPSAASAVGSGLAPYVPYLFYPPVLPTGPTPVMMPGPFANYWQPNTTGLYSVGDIVFARWVDRDNDDDITNGLNPDGVFQYSEMPEPKFQIAYRMIGFVDSNGDNVVDGGPPGAFNFPTSPGRRFTDGEIIWESFDNRHPLQSIRMTFRFLDKQTENMRQLSLVIPMTELTK